MLEKKWYLDACKLNSQNKKLHGIYETNQTKRIFYDIYKK